MSVSTLYLKLFFTESVKSDLITCNTGRTGRCQQIGTAYTFFTSNNQRQAKDLISVLEEAGQTVSPQLQELAQSSRNVQTGRNRWNQRKKVNNGDFRDSFYFNVSRSMIFVITNHLCASFHLLSLYNRHILTSK